MTELKDVLHLYNNPFNKVKVLVDDDEVKYLWDVDVVEGGDYVNITLADKEFRSISGDDDGWSLYNDDKTLSRIKPILRKLSDMTEDEWNEHGIKFSLNVLESVRSRLLRYSDKPKHVFVLENRLTTNTLRFNDGIILISMGFDLFQLIENGQAIDKTSLIGGKQEEVKI